MPFSLAKSAMVAAARGSLWGLQQIMHLKSFAQRLAPSRCSLTDDGVAGEDQEVRPERNLGLTQGRAHHPEESQREETREGLGLDHSWSCSYGTRCGV